MSEALVSRRADVFFDVPERVGGGEAAVNGLLVCRLSPDFPYCQGYHEGARGGRVWGE
ncbi:MAG: hypothetical protein ABI766_13305 [Gemmatimonadales bacterium]